MRVALIRSGARSVWWSCVHITRNLELAYQAAFPARMGHATRTFQFDPLEGRRRAALCVGELEEFQPELVVLIDHAAHPVEFLKAWAKVAGKLGTMPLWIHCYGDFPIQIGDWVSLSPALLGKAVHFICASPASAGLIGEFLLPARGGPPIVPFPIDTRVHRPAPEGRQEVRRELGIGEDEWVVVYSGRVSLQKNPTLAVRAVAEWVKERGEPTTFLMVGNPDSIGAEMLGVSLPTYFYASYLRDKLAEYTRDVPLRVISMPHLDERELVGFHGAADLYLSLSMHHDEDYGMAPAEALCAGTPALLSGWGGFHGFADIFAQAPELAAVQIATIATEAGVHSFDREEIHAQLDRARALARAPLAVRTRRRERIAHVAAAGVSIAAVAEQLRALAQTRAPRFAGFTASASHFAATSYQMAHFRKHRFEDPHYRQLYSHYLAGSP